MDNESHREKQIEIMREHQNKVLRSTLLATGAGIMMVGLMAIFTPETFVAMVNFGFQIKYGPEDVKLFGVMLTALGLGDIVLASMIFKDRKRL
ncbi:MAG: hypothetical protein KDI90_10105 [Alphaproteobacteria bacterium]|nr:hypothetical protein [Alphaproteobacteria bacterium]MCB9974953.1 hypothetical protein [Rhodospirillales bacterium]